MGPVIRALTRNRKNNAAFASVLAISVVAGAGLAVAQSTSAIPPSLMTPNKVQSRIGTLEFKDGAPTMATAEKVYDTLDFTRAYERLQTTASAARPHSRNSQRL